MAQFQVSVMTVWQRGSIHKIRTLKTKLLNQIQPSLPFLLYLIMCYVKMSLKFIAKLCSLSTIKYKIKYYNIGFNILDNT